MGGKVDAATWRLDPRRLLRRSSFAKTCGKSAWTVSWAADCLFEKVELLSRLHQPHFRSFLLVGGATPLFSISPAMI